MAKFTKDQVLSIRDNADKLLKKMESEEKAQNDKLWLSLTNFKSDIQKLSDRVGNNQQTDKLIEAFSSLQTQISQMVGNSKVDMSPVTQALSRIEVALNRPPEFIDLSGLETKLDKLTNLLKPQPQKDRTDEVIKAIQSIKLEVPEIEFPESIAVSNFRVPQPVTNININPLRGALTNTAVTVTTSATALPTTPADNRRAIVIYNNSASVLYVGGSDVTTSNGMPVPAASYSPSLDAGPRMIVYGIVATGTANVRVMELANDAIGG